LSGLLILRRTRPLRGNQVSPNVNPSSSACGRREQ
jgi:hypothetical protein